MQLATIKRGLQDIAELTGLLLTRRCEILGVAKRSGDAEEAVQCGTDRCFIAPDLGANNAGQDACGCVP